MVDVRPIKDDPYPNELITMAPYQVHAENRIKYPMVRKSWLEGGAKNGKPELRGRDEWVRVSWDKALHLVAGEISRLQKSMAHHLFMPVLTAGKASGCSTTRERCCSA